MDIETLNKYTESVSTDEINELRDRILKASDIRAVKQEFQSIIKDSLGSSSKVRLKYDFLKFILPRFAQQNFFVS